MICFYAGHINNLYNTTFWAMVQQGGMSNTDAERELQVSYLTILVRLATDRRRAPCRRIRTRFCSGGSESIIIMSLRYLRKGAWFIDRWALFCLLSAEAYLHPVSTRDRAKGRSNGGWRPGACSLEVPAREDAQTAPEGESCGRPCRYH